MAKVKEVGGCGRSDEKEVKNEIWGYSKKRGG